MTQDINLGVQARGPQGPQGPQGEPGPMSTLSMLDNGNIAVNGADSGVGGMKEIGSSPKYDFNTMTTPCKGVSMNGCQNAPESQAWGMFVILKTANKYTTQIWSNLDSGVTYIRTNRPDESETKWNAWNKLGGVTVDRIVDNLLPMKMPQLTMGNDENIPTDSALHGAAQRYNSVPTKFFEILPKNQVYIDVLKGDTVKQSFVLETDANISQFTMSFYNNEHHLVICEVTKIGENKYQISGEWTFDKDCSWRVFDIYNDEGTLVDGTYMELSQPYAAIISSGGVVSDNLLTKIGKQDGVTYQNGIYTLDIPAFNTSGASSFDYITQYSLGIKAGATLTFSFMARGSGILKSYVWGTTTSGLAIENRKDWELTDKWQVFTQTISPELAPVNGSFLFRQFSNDGPIKGQIANLSLTEVGGGAWTDLINHGPHYTEETDYIANSDGSYTLQCNNESKYHNYPYNGRVGWNQDDFSSLHNKKALVTFEAAAENTDSVEISVGPFQAPSDPITITGSEYKLYSIVVDWSSPNTFSVMFYSKSTIKIKNLHVYLLPDDYTD